MRFVALPVLVLLAVPAAADEAPFILKRCEARVGSYGGGVVKSCVDGDSAAHVALQSYPASARPVIARCEHMMQDHSWQDVKACADRDLEAAKQLGSHTDRQAVSRCEREMGRFGAAMVKACVDRRD